jgi:hypothetical protein
MPARLLSARQLRTLERQLAAAPAGRGVRITVNPKHVQALIAEVRAERFNREIGVRP